MEAWEVDIITANLDKLTSNTTCSSVFLNKFRASKTLSQDDVDELTLPSDTLVTRSTKFYRKIITRENGFTNLMGVLNETNQSGARSILKTAITKTKHSHLEDVGCFSYDKDVLLGKGSNGTMVFKGRFGGRDVAVKRVNSDTEQMKTITEEIETLKQCDRHENIVRYYGTSFVDTFILIGLELCDITLKRWLPGKPIKICPLEALRQVTVGLEWLHSKRIVHRDLKPENILLTSDPIRVKISDFGLSRSIAEEQTYVSSVGTGTHGWVASEILLQFDTEGDYAKYKFTFESDIFSLGCVYYYVLTDGKHHPFGSRGMRMANILTGNFTIDTLAISHASAENLQFLTLMISKDPQIRPSCSALLTYPIFLKTTEQHNKSMNPSNSSTADSKYQLAKTRFSTSPSLNESERTDDTDLDAQALGRGVQKTKQSSKFWDLVENFNKLSGSTKSIVITDPSEELDHNNNTLPNVSETLTASTLSLGQPHEHALAISLSNNDNSEQLPLITDKPINTKSVIQTEKITTQNSGTINISSISFDENTVLGHGSFGTVVYKGKYGDRDVAIKKVHLYMFGGVQALHKVNLWAKVDTHENVVQYFGAEQINFQFGLIALQLCEMSLKEWVQNNANNGSSFRLNTGLSCMDILIQITTGLEWLHSNRIVHKDIRPENVLLLLQEKQAKLSDLCLNKHMLDGNTRRHSQWIAPEILLLILQRKSRKCKFTYASDIFSLGCLYYYVLTDGKFAFGDSNRYEANILGGNPRIAKSDMKYYHEHAFMPKLISLMVSKDPKCRPNCATIISYPFSNQRNSAIECSTNMQPFSADQDIPLIIASVDYTDQVEDREIMTRNVFNTAAETSTQTSKNKSVSSSENTFSEAGM